ncbi:unnamed protein product, partial [Meganyctiphanes norvegica]
MLSSSSTPWPRMPMQRHRNYWTLMMLVLWLDMFISCYANSIPDDHHLVQGDILMPLGQLPEDITDGPQKQAESRKLIQHADGLWPEGDDGWPEVPYRIENSASGYSGAIKKGLAQWEKHTCIRFTTVSDTFEGPHIRFYKGKGCWSKMGRQVNAKGQQLSIGKGCQHVGVVVHEVGHAMGFAHEHCRSDRGDTIKVLLKNVANKNKKNFNMVSTRNKVPYDFTSVMQYGIYMDSKNGQPTMVTRDPYDIRHIWKRRNEMSFRDAKEANIGYNCIVKWSAQFPDHPGCQNEGYIGGTGTCICPRGTQGEFCEDKTKDYYPELSCGGNVTESTTITPIKPNNPKKPSK